MKDNLMRKFTLGPDARSNRGIFARGKNVYKGASTSANRGMKLPSITPNLKPNQEAIARRLKRGK